MPFKRGVAPVRRTLKYLEASPIIFKDKVKVMTINYNEPIHEKFLEGRKPSYTHHEGYNKILYRVSLRLLLRSCFRNQVPKCVLNQKLTALKQLHIISSKLAVKRSELV